MAKTAAEKILSLHSGASCRSGDLVGAELDLVYLTDGSAPSAIRLFRETGATRVFDPARIAMVIDHYVPCPSAEVAGYHRLMRDFGYEQGCVLSEEGQGVCHNVLGERGFVQPGMLVVGADSHTVTYGARGAFATGIGSTDAAVAMAAGRLWFRVPESIRLTLEGALGPGVMGKDIALLLNHRFGPSGATYRAVEIWSGGSSLSQDDLAVICNTSVEWGAKAAIAVEPLLAVDVGDAGNAMAPDAGCSYADQLTVDLAGVAPLVALPHAVDNVVPVRDAPHLTAGVCVIGTCSGGRYSDLEAAAVLLRGRHVQEGTRLLVIPASRSVYARAMARGLLATFTEAGAVVLPPGCGPCCGTGNGIPADDEFAITTANRNFLGRMGNPKASVVLASPLTVAASAVTGYLTDPRDLMQD